MRARRGLRDGDLARQERTRNGKRAVCGSDGRVLGGIKKNGGAVVRGGAGERGCASGY